MSIDHVILTAPDISCEHCVATVEQAVRALDGVTSVTASADTKVVDVVFDSSLLSQPEIEAALSGAGYPIA